MLQCGLTVTGNTAVWELQVSNTSALATANYTWLAQGSGGTTNIQKIEKLSGAGGSVVSIVNPVNGIYQLGDLIKSSNSYYRVTAGYANCTKDTLNLKYGYSCTNYPASLSTANCSFSAQQLYIIPQPPQLQLQIITQPRGPQSLCVDTTYTLKLTNVQTGTAYSPNIQTTLPFNGFIIEPGSSQVQYPKGIFTTIPDPVLTNGMYNWNIGATIPALTTTGMIVNDSLKLSFKVQATDCSFASGDYLTFLGSGVSGCGTSVSTFNTTSNPYILTGDPLATVNNFKLNKAVDVSTLLACEGQGFTYTYIAVNNGPNVSDASREALSIEVPDFLNISDFAPSAGGGVAPDNSTIQQQTSGGVTTYSWTMPAGVAVGDSIKFNVKFTISNRLALLTGCTSSHIIIRNIVTNTFSTPAPCVPGGVCESKTIKGTDAIDILIQKYQAKAAFVQAAPGNIATIKITNTGLLAIPASTLQYSLYADMNNNGVYDAADNLLLAGPLTVDRAILPLAIDTFTKVIDLNPLSPLAYGKSILLVVQPGACNCESSRLADPGAALPVQLVSFTATNRNCSNTIKWVTTKEQNITNFSVERSTNGHDFVNIATLKPEGAYEQQHSYSLSDEHVLNGVSYYYRLRTVDRDGKYNISKIVSAKVSDCNSGGNLVTVYPNPVQRGVQQLTVEMNNIPTGNYELRLYDASGRTLRRQAVAINNITTIQKAYIDVAGIASDVYVVRLISNDNNTSYQVKVMVMQ